MIDFTIKTIAHGGKRTDVLGPLLQIKDPRQAQAINKNIAQRITNLTKRHLKKFDRENPNQMGGKRTHFVGEMGDSVTASHDALSAKASIAHIGFKQRLLGGEIKPVNGKYLTIPAIMEAYGKSAREFDNLTVLYSHTKKRAVALVETAATPVRRTKQGYKAAKGDDSWVEEVGGRVVFWLVKSVQQRGNRDLLPTDQEFADEAIRVLQLHLRLRGRGK